MRLLLPEWPSSHVAIWVVSVAAAYGVVWIFNDFILSFVEVVDDRIALIFLPAFVRVAAVMVAGLAGWLGLWLGSLLLGLFYVGDSLEVALLSATASALSVGLAAVLVTSWFGQRTGSLNSIHLKGMLLTAVLAAPLSVGFHSTVWAATDIQHSGPQLLMMMAGDLGGVALGYLMLRLGVRAWRLNLGSSA